MLLVLTPVLFRGKVFVFTGILPICQDEDGLAAVLGHEIAHVVAHHTGERMSSNIITMGAVFLTALLFDVSGHLPSLILNLMYSLPNSRTQEVSLFGFLEGPIANPIRRRRITLALVRYIFYVCRCH